MIWMYKIKCCFSFGFIYRPINCLEVILSCSLGSVIKLISHTFSNVILILYFLEE